MVAESTCSGVETYDKVQAPLIRDVQRKTTMIPVYELEETSWQQLLHRVAWFQEVISHAKAQAENMTLLACHILRQDSLQACFSWHQDNRNNPFTRLSMVFLLSEAASTMRIAGFEPFRYASQGDGCAFPSEAHHCSGGSSPGTVKITFFFGDATPSAALLVARQARGEWCAVQCQLTIKRNCQENESRRQILVKRMSPRRSGQARETVTRRYNAPQARKLR